MKIRSLLFSSIAALTLALTALATGDHPHEKKTAGPNGGRVLTNVAPHAEFFITTDRKVQITFLGEDGKAIAPAAEVVTVTAGDRSAPTKLSFSRSGEVLISDVALPAGKSFPAVVQIKSTPDAKAVVEKFTVDFSKCGGCGYAEYACICGH